MALDFKLNEKPFYWGLGIGLFLAIAIAGSAEYFMFKGMRQEIAGMRTELTGLEAEIARGRAAEKRIVQFKEEIKKLELELEKLLRILPSKYNTDELIKKVETLANQGEFNVRKFAPGKVETKDFYAEWPINIEVDVTYHNLALFFDKLAKFSRIININEMSVTAIPGATIDPKKTIAAKFTAMTFIYIGDTGGESSASGGKG